MKFRFLLVPLVGVVIFTLSAAVNAQPSKANLTVKLGTSVVALPPPEGYEEATTQFEVVKTRFEAATPPEGDLLAGYLSAPDCELLRKGQPAPYRSWMLINVFRQARTHESSTEEFARIVGYAQQEGGKLLQPDRTKIKERVAELDSVLSKETSKDVKLELGQPKILGAFERRSNVFSNLIMTSLKVSTDGKEAESTPVVATLTMLLVKQRIVGIYAYKKYESAADAESLMQFTTKWINEILAAN